MRAVDILPAHIDLVGVCEKVPSVYVVYVAVAVIVNAVVGDFIRVCPDCVLQFRVRDIHPGVNEGNGYGAFIFQAVIPAPGIPDIDVDSGIGLGLDGGKIAGAQRREGNGGNPPAVRRT